MLAFRRETVVSFLRFGLRPSSACARSSFTSCDAEIHIFFFNKEVDIGFKDYTDIREHW
jgi:hypothetical protein